MGEEGKAGNTGSGSVGSGSFIYVILSHGAECPGFPSVFLSNSRTSSCVTQAYICSTWATDDDESLGMVRKGHLPDQYSPVVHLPEAL